MDLDAGVPVRGQDGSSCIRILRRTSTAIPSHAAPSSETAARTRSALMEALFWRAAGPLIGDNEPSAVPLAGMMTCAADGMLVSTGGSGQPRYTGLQAW